MTTRLFGTCAAIALAILLNLPSPAQAQTSASFDLPAQSLADSLRAVGKRTDTNILIDRKLVRGLQAQALKAQLTVDEALTRLLAGSGLKHQFVNAHTVILVSEAASTPAANKPALEQRPNSAPPATHAIEGTHGEYHFAQVDTERTDVPRTSTSATQEERVEIEEILVTGTHIRGAPSAGSRVIPLDRDYIANSGYATVDGLLKTLPQNFSGGVAQGQAFPLADQTAGNFNQGAAVNLRGLGADSTLVLIDGRRQPAGGVFGAFVDISSIPTSAIERIEILTDGASALYGSDAVAGVVNFILRKDFDGAESQVRVGGADGGADQLQISQILGRSWATGSAIVGYQYDDQGNLQRSKRAYSGSNDLTPLGGSDYQSIFSNPANILDPATFAPAYAIPAGQDGTSLQPGDFLAGVINRDTSSSGMDLVGDQEIHSAFFNAAQRLGDRYEVFASGRFAERRHRWNALPRTGLLFVPSSNAFFVDPFGGSAGLLVAYDFSDDLGLAVSAGSVETYVGTIGASVQLPADWEISISGTYGHEELESVGRNGVDTFGSNLATALADPNPATAFNPFGDGSNTSPATLAAIRTDTLSFADATSKNANAILTGPLFPIGDAYSKVAFGFDIRDEDLESETGGPPQVIGRRVRAAFAEVALPLVTSGSHPALRELNVSLAGRYEDYSDLGGTFDQRVGIAWVPGESMKVMATWGTSFKAPRLAQLETTFPDAFAAFIPLQSPSGSVDALVRSGNNADLQEETADVWTAGVEWKPVNVPGFNASLTFWRISYEDRISPVGPTNNSFGILFEADEWADAINFDPTPEEVAVVCRSPTFSFPGNPVSVDQCLARTPAAIVDLRLTNLAQVTVEGVDVDGRYRFDTRAGAITLGLNGVYMPSYDRQVTRNSPDVDLSNTTGNVLRLRLRGEASWSQGGWSVGTFVNYANSYEDTFSVSGQSIDAWTTVDGMVSYRFGDSQSGPGGLTTALHVLNLFDEDPPFANVGFSNAAYGYDTANADPLGRVLTLQVSKAW